MMAWSFYKKDLIMTGTQLPISPDHFHHRRETMTSLIVNYLPSSKHWNTENTTSKAQDTLLRSGQITKIWNTSKWLVIYHNVKPIGACF